MKPLKILVLGSDSMAGHVLIDYFAINSNYKIEGIEENHFIEQSDNILQVIKNYNPNVIINTIRMTVQACEENPVSAIAINSILPKKLERIFESTKVKVIHLSTDCVFSGTIGNYSENDIPDGRSVYSMTKICGEIINDKDITIRTSYIGPNLINKREELFDWFLYQDGVVDGYSSSIWNGITTLELAKKMDQLIMNNYSGLYHLCSKEKLTKYALLKLIKKQWSMDRVCISKVKKEVIDRSLKDTKKYFTTPKYETMFKELFDFMKRRRSLYAHYKF